MNCCASLTNDFFSVSQGVAFLCYDFAYIVDAARNAKKDGKDFVGINVDLDADKSVTKSGVSDAVLSRSFTPVEVKKVIEDNIDILVKYDKKKFKGKKLQGIYDSLNKLEAKAAASGIDRPLALEEFDDLYQTSECVYGVVRDSIKKRIIVVFRGTENKLAFGSNWITNASVAHTDGVLPDCLKGKVDGDRLEFHYGFYGEYDAMKIIFLYFMILGISPDLLFFFVRFPLQ